MITLIIVLFVIGALFLIAAWMDPNEGDIRKWSFEVITGIVLLGADAVIALGYVLYRAAI